MRRAVRWLALLVVLAVAFGVGYFWPVLVRPPLVVGQDAVTDTASARVEPVVENVDGGDVIVVRPPRGVQEQDVLVVLYQGGLVRPQAYEWLARALAVQGYPTLIPVFSFDLAVTDPGRATALIQRYGDSKRIVLAGHSLGGAMAAQYVSDELKGGREPVSGLVLMAAYPPGGADLTTAGLSAIVLRAENDGVADAAEVTGGLRLLPAGSTEVVIEGAVHSFFGRYGPQSGDGVPEVSRADAEAQILLVITDFLAEIAR